MEVKIFKLFLLLTFINFYTKRQRRICLLVDKFIQFTSENVKVQEKCEVISRINLAAIFWRAWIESIKALLGLSPHVILAYSSMEMTIVAT